MHNLQIHKASASYQMANHYYTGERYWELRAIIVNDDEEFDEYNEKQEKIYQKLKNFIKNDNLKGLVSCKEFKDFDINHRFGDQQKTLLHLAYFFSKPKIVEFLLNKGADERIPDEGGLIPIETAKDTYDDSLPRVINEIFQRYLYLSKKNDVQGPHLLFDVIQSFIHEKKWSYNDKEGSYKQYPFRDGRALSLWGLPDLSYHVNCADLTHLFVKAAQKVGIAAYEVWYREYKSILPSEKEKFGVLGKLTMFDVSEAKNLSIIFNRHCVAYSAGWHFDLTLMCKYQDMKAILMLKM